MTLRGDTAYSQTEYVDGWDEQGVEFVFGYGAHKNIVDEAESLPESDWSLLERKGYEIKTVPRACPVNVRDRIVEQREYTNIHLVDEHYAEFEYQPTQSRNKYRMVVVRKTLTHEKGQKLLFVGIVASSTSRTSETSLRVKSFGSRTRVVIRRGCSEYRKLK